MPVSREAILWAYRLILGREPESEQAIHDHLNAENDDALRAALLSSREFREKVLGAPKTERVPLHEDERPVWLFVGNCQADRLARLCAQLCPDIRAEAIEVVRTQAVPDLPGHLPAIVELGARAQIAFIQPYVLDLMREHGVSIPTRCRHIESLVFDAFHPDIAYVNDNATGAPLFGVMGQYQSALALWGYRAGLSIDEAVALYRTDVMAALGYLDFWDTAIERLRRVDQAVGTDLVRWAHAQRGRSVFMHSMNHPAKSLLAEYAAQLLAQEGYTAQRDAERYVADEFLNGPVWPVYPAIAQRLGVVGSTQFKSPNTRAHPDIVRVHDLDAFVRASFALFAQFGALQCERIDHPPFTTLPDFLARSRPSSNGSPAPASHENRGRDVATAAAATAPTPTTRSATPYTGLPDSQFWSRSIARVALEDVDLVTDSPRVIGPHTRVASAGSCFAQHIARALREAGLCYFVTEDGGDLSPEVAAQRQYGAFSARYGNLYTARQLVQLIDRAYGAFEPSEPWWTLPSGAIVDPFRPTVEPHGFASIEAALSDRTDHLAAVRRLIEELDVFIFTLGLTEAWRCRADGAVLPVVPGAHGGTFDAQRYEFVNFTVDEVVADLTAFHERLAKINPRARVIYTVSPVPLVASYAREHVAVASSASKAVLRAAAQAIVGEHPHRHYFPSYEIITGPWTRGRYFGPDARAVTDEGVATVMRTFRRHYVESPTSAPALGRLQAIGEVLCDEELLDRSGVSETAADAERVPLLVHLHIQKTGGSSLNELLAATYGQVRTGTGADLEALESPAADDVACFFGHVNADHLPTRRRAVSTIAFLREPRERLQSTYAYLRTLSPTGPEGHALVQRAHLSHDIDAFLQDPFVADSPEIWNHATWSLVGERQWRQWKTELSVCAASAIDPYLAHTVRPILQARLRSMFFIGRFADFDRDVARLYTQLGHPPPTTVPNRNSRLEASQRNGTPLPTLSPDDLSRWAHSPQVADACRLDALLYALAFEPSITTV